MKKLLLSLLAVSTLAVAVVYKPETTKNNPVTIVDYDASHKDAIMELSFQDPELFFPGYKMIPEAMHPMIDEANKQEMLATCDEPLKYKKILLDDTGNEIGFVVFFKSREPSLESIKRALEQQMGSVPFTDEQLLAQKPDLKLTDAECAEFIMLESLAVGRDARGKGYGRMLTQHAIQGAQQKWPELTVIKLKVNESNTVACKLYESEGFVASEIQQLAFMGVVQYEKQFK